MNLTLNGGQTTCILGASGVGKSTLLRIIANLVSANHLSQGKDHTNASISSDNLIPVCEQISYIAQTDLLLPWLNVIDNVLLGFRLRKTNRKTLSAQQSLAKNLLKEVGLEQAIHMHPHQLSGGMKQRIALVRTFIEGKPIVLMDEPFSSLDTINRFHLQDLTANLLHKKTILLVTHDPLEALRLADHIYIMSGNPAMLSSFLTLNSQTPRDPSSEEMITLYSSLLQRLLGR